MENVSPFLEVTLDGSVAKTVQVLSALAAKFRVPHPEDHRPFGTAEPILFPHPVGESYPQLTSFLSAPEELNPQVAVALPNPQPGRPPLGYSRLALKSSAAAMNQILGGPGRWVMASSADQISGLMTLARAIVVDIPPVLTRAANTSVSALNRAVDQAINHSSKDGKRTYLELSARQLVALLRQPADRLQRYRQLSALLVTGLTEQMSLYRVAVRQGLPIRTGYGLAQTAGICLVDGSPLPGVQVATVQGRIWVSGTCLMQGYLQLPQRECFIRRGARNWLKTADSGVMQGGKLQVRGRLRDTISSGGIRIQGPVVESVIRELPQVDQAAVLGIPDQELGQLVTAVVTVKPGTDPQLIAPLQRLSGEVTSSQGEGQGPGVPTAQSALPGSAVSAGSDLPEQPGYTQTQAGLGGSATGLQTPDPKVVQDLKEDSLLQFKAIKADGSRQAQLSQAAAQLLPKAQNLTPLEVAMAAMAAKIRGENVDVVAAAHTGVLPANLYSSLKQSQSDFSAANNGAGAKQFLPADQQSAAGSTEIADVESYQLGSSAETQGKNETSQPVVAPRHPNLADSYKHNDSNVRDRADDAASQSNKNDETIKPLSHLENVASQVGDSASNSSNLAAAISRNQNQVSLGPDASSLAPQADTNLALLIRGHVTRELDRAHAPRAVILLEQMPLLGGRIDRETLKKIATEKVASGQAWIR